MEMNENERRAHEIGVWSVLSELFNVIAELEESRADTSYGRGQKYILREVIARMTE